MAHPLRQAGVGQQCANGRPVAVVVVVDQWGHVDLERPQPGPLHLVHVEPDGRGQHGLDGGGHRAEVGARVEQGGEQHVTGHPVAGVHPGVCGIGARHSPIVGRATGWTAPPPETTGNLSPAGLTVGRTPRTALGGPLAP